MKYTSIFLILTLALLVLFSGCINKQEIKDDFKSNDNYRNYKSVDLKDLDKDSSLSELVLTKESFGRDFIPVDREFGYVNDAFEYVGDKNYGKGLSDNGWLENQEVTYYLSSNQKEMDVSKPLIKYWVTISRYKDVPETTKYFKDSIVKYYNDMNYEATDSNSELSQTLLEYDLGDGNSFVRKYINYDHEVYETVKHYMIRYYVGNMFVNIDAEGFSRALTDEDVISIAQEQEERIREVFE